MTVIFHGNNKDWINQTYLKQVLEGQGELRPTLTETDEPWKKEQFKKWYGRYGRRGNKPMLSHESVPYLNAIPKKGMAGMAGFSLEVWQVPHLWIKVIPRFFIAFQKSIV